MASTELEFNTSVEKETMLNEGRAFFVNKLIGKFLLLLVWIGLVVANIYCLKYMDKEKFIEWIILSVGTFLIILLLVDPLIYWFLAMIMTKEKRFDYYSK